MFDFIKKHKFLSGVFFSFLLIVFFRLSFFVDEMVNLDSIKNYAEKKVSGIFNASVKIDDIRIGFSRHVSLSGLKINPKLSKNLFYFIDVKKIIFKYSFLNLLKLSTNVPNKISFESPRIEFSKFQIPYSLFGEDLFSKKGQMRLSVNDGTVAYNFSGIKTRFLLKNISADIIPQALNEIKVALAGEGDGDLRGKVTATGVFNGKKNEVDLELSLEDISVLSDSFFPIRSVNGIVHVFKNEILLSDIKFFLRSLPVTVSGTIFNYNSAPKLDLTFEVKALHLRALFKIEGDLDDLKASGHFSFSKFSYDFTGALKLNEGGIVLEELVINEKYFASGSFPFDKGVYDFLIKNGNQEIKCNFSHDDFNLKLELSLNHISFLNYDFVVNGYVELEPDVAYWREDKLVFNAQIETDYMIFNYTPLNEFKGSFKFSPSEITEMKFSWGEVYAAKGEVSFSEPPIVNAELSVSDFNLRDKNTLGEYIIPESIDAVVNGKVDITGNAKNPQFDGHLKSGQGRIKALDFDKVVMNFSGNTELLSLYDSKIQRGNSTFYLKGNVDFTKRNIFHDVLLESSEKIILWRGWDLSKNVSEDEISLKKKVTDSIDLSVRSAFGDDEVTSDVYQESQLSLDYNYQKDQTFSITVEDDDADETVSLKHKITF